jgi:tRNA A-37 threonylcarbamoyl transferase component Bud32
MLSKLTYDRATENLEMVLIKGRFTKADVFITRFEGRRFVVKDYSQKGFCERNIVGRIVIGRESRAYKALSGIEGLPPCVKRLSSYALAVEYLEGRDFGGLGRGDLDLDVIRQFERLLGELHKRGWVHLDLHRRTNILFVEGHVFFVDLASALHTGSIPLIGRCLTDLFGLADRLSLIKMKQIFGPELLTERELRWLKLRNMVMPTKWDDE